MTGEEWAQCADPVPMLYGLKHRATERRLKLWAVACCARVLGWPQRMLWGWARLSSVRRALGAAEGHVAGCWAVDALTGRE